MATASIPVDLWNPGQVFASLGLLEVSEALGGGCAAGFDWSDPHDVRFVLRSPGAGHPVLQALEFLAAAEVQAIAAPGSGLDMEKWHVPSRTLAVGAPYPVPPPRTVASLPAALTLDGCSFVVSSWADTRVPGLISTRRDNVKFWAGSAGKPGAQFLAESIALARENVRSAREDPFNFAAPQGGSLRFDWRRDYIALEIGFSLDKHASMKPLGYPLVEALAVIGVNHARPLREDKLRYRYAVVGRSSRRQPESDALLPPLLLRAALGTGLLPFPTRTFTMHLDWPGQANQARCITTVTEDATP